MDSSRASDAQAKSMTSVTRSASAPPASTKPCAGSHRRPWSTRASLSRRWPSNRSRLSGQGRPLRSRPAESAGARPPPARRVTSGLHSLGHQLPLPADEDGQEIELVSAGHADVLQDVLRVPGAEACRQHRLTAALQGEGIGRGIEAVLGERSGLVLAARHDAHGRRHVHELERRLEVRRRPGHDLLGGCREAPPVLPPSEGPSLARRLEVDAVDLIRRLPHEPGRLEGDEALHRTRPPRADHDEEKRQCGYSGAHQQQARTRTPHRRRHQTTAPTAITPSGSSTSRTRKMRFICCPVSRMNGVIGTPARTLGVRSSRASHRTIESTRSLFDIYGKKELLAKSPSPTTTTRNGLGDACAPDASGQAPSTATARTRRPGGSVAAERADPRPAGSATG